MLIFDPANIPWVVTFPHSSLIPHKHPMSCCSSSFIMAAAHTHKHTGLTSLHTNTAPDLITLFYAPSQVCPFNWFDDLYYSTSGIITLSFHKPSKQSYFNIMMSEFWSQSKWHITQSYYLSLSFFLHLAIFMTQVAPSRLMPCWSLYRWMTMQYHNAPTTSGPTKWPIHSIKVTYKVKVMTCDLPRVNP